MKQLRHTVPILGALALIVLFLKMPEAPNIFGLFKCKTCVNSDPYLPMIGGGYFAILIATSLLFPSFPGPLTARSGLIWSLLLALTFTYIHLPFWCISCLIGHVCNILIWAIWWKSTSVTHEQHAYFKERLFFTMFAPICTMALFSSLNLTFLVYNLKSQQGGLIASLQPGDALPNFMIYDEKANNYLTHTDLLAGPRSYINFVSPHCPYCTEQLSILKDSFARLNIGSYRLINISSSLTPDLTHPFSPNEWLEDKNGQLRELFKVSGYPTLFVVGSDGKIQQVIAGVSEELKNISKANE